jgi:hypothetical protein
MVHNTITDPGTDGTSCNDWEMLLGNGTGKVDRKLGRLTNWAGFCMDRTLATSDGKRLTFLKWTGQSAIYVSDIKANGKRFTTPVRLTSSQ